MSRTDMWIMVASVIAILMVAAQIIMWMVGGFNDCFGPPPCP